MSLPDRSDRQNEILSLLAGERHDEAQSRLAEYLGEAARAQRPDEIQAIHQFLARALHTVRAQRAHLAVELTGLSNAHAYCQTSTPVESHLDCTG